MPRIYISNAWLSNTDMQISPESCQLLWRRVAKAANINTKVVEVYLTANHCSKLTMHGGLIKEMPVFISVHLFAGRSTEAKQKIMRAISDFLRSNGCTKDTDTTFVEYPSGAFFENEIQIPGGPGFIHFSNDNEDDDLALGG